MAKIRCSNCEKSVRIRFPNGKIHNEGICKATGKDISGHDFYEVRNCDEFLSRLEYSQQFRTVFDKVMKGLAMGKEIKDIVK